MTQAMAPASMVEARDFGWPDFLATRPAGEPDWLAAMRRAAMARFSEMGLPSVRDEDWRQTPIGPIARTEFRRPVEDAAVFEDALAPLTFGHAFDGHQIVFVNGRYAPTLSSLGAQDGVRIESLARVLDREPALVERHLGKILKGGNAFAALEYRFSRGRRGGADPRGRRPGQPHPRRPPLDRERADRPSPIRGCWWSPAAPARPPSWRATAGRTAQAYLTNTVAEIALEDGAIVDHYKVQREGLAAFHIATLGRDPGRATRASRRIRSPSVPPSRGRTSTRPLPAKAASARWADFSSPPARSSPTPIPASTTRSRAAPAASSTRGSWTARRAGVFVGRIYVAKDAQKTDAQQTNKNLLLSRHALVHSVPQLEILADDVKCKHGSTTGQLDPAALFYLRSRGIGEDAARSLLVYAFASDVVARIKVEALRKGLGRYLRERLPSAADIEEAVV